jgi:hypothetical protein
MSKQEKLRRLEAKFHNLGAAKEQVEAAMAKERAMRGWLTDPPPPPPRDYHPGEEHKWYKMMGAAHLLPPREREALRRSLARISPPGRGGPALPIAERYSAGPKRPAARRA